MQGTNVSLLVAFEFTLVGFDIFGEGGGGQKEYSGVCLFFDRVRAATMCRLLVKLGYPRPGTLVLGIMGQD